MAYDDPINNNQGAIKTSELFTDEELKIIENAVGESGLSTLRKIMDPISDAIRMNNFILSSTGEIRWDGADIYFDQNSQDNDIELRLLMADQDAASNTVKLVLEGTTGANTDTLFNTLNLSTPGDMAYIEISRDDVINAAVGIVNIGNVTALAAPRVRVVNVLTGGMPKMTSADTMNIPLAVKLQWSDGIDTYNDLWWIPHGIRWPENAVSVIGAVVVRGFDAYPNRFVRNQSELLQAVTQLSGAGGGGIIMIQESFAIDSNITIPTGVTLLARSNMNNTSFQASNTITMLVGGRLTMESESKMFNVSLACNESYGDSFVESMVSIQGSRVEVRDCHFSVPAGAGSGAGTAICVNVDGNDNRLWNCKFRLGVGGETSSDVIGIRYNSGTGNIDTDSKFDET